MIGVIDYGIGNVGSVHNMLRKIGGDVRCVSNVEQLAEFDSIILPGVGAFDNAINRLENSGFFSAIKTFAKTGKPILGICLGLQLLMEQSEEGIKTGLSLVPGQVKRFSFPHSLADKKIPHMGWNRVRSSHNQVLFREMQEPSRFYFVHSYHVVCSQDYVVATAHYGYDFTCAVQNQNIMGVQFHPEKSHRHGMRLLKNFIES